jgi:hypothetical protein
MDPSRVGRQDSKFGNNCWGKAVFHGFSGRVWQLRNELGEAVFGSSPRDKQSGREKMLLSKFFGK